jgi:hypothetical protein
MTNEDIEQNLAAIAELASAHGEKLVLAGILPISDIDPATNTVGQQFYGPGGDAISRGSPIGVVVQPARVAPRSEADRGHAALTASRPSW